MSAGRPSLYKPSYCDDVIEYGKQGKSIAWMAATIGVDRTTIEIAWPQAHPEFSISLTQARLLSQLWWEDAGQSNLVTPGFSASVWSRSMAARFPADWREVKGNEISGPSGGPVQTVSRIELVGVQPDDNSAD